VHFLPVKKVLFKISIIEQYEIIFELKYVALVTKLNRKKDKYLKVSCLIQLFFSFLNKFRSLKLWL